MSENLLIVEDEFIVANNLRLILERAGYNVCGIAASVEEARKIIKKCAVDIVLLDIHLKGKLSGIDLAIELREQYIAFVYLSANSNQSILEAAKATEPYGFLVKPYREKDVLITLDIARYRHTHSSEAKLKQETALLSTLQSIATIQLGWDDRILKAAISLQPYIGFDLFTISATGAAPAGDNRFLRVGFNEYQSIGLNELSIITRIKQKELEDAITSSPIVKTAALRTCKEFEENCVTNRLTSVYAHAFQLQSALTIPLPVAGSNDIVFSFFSRKANAYSSEHLALLLRLQSYLSAIAAHMHLPATSSFKNTAVTNNKPALPGANHHFHGIIGKSTALLNVLDLVTQVAPLDTSVLIMGESGTGKERIAECLHENSLRKNKQLVKINCATLPHHLVESELFGHEKGAFTGATDKKIGKFELANNGTIFLDEIGELPLDQQVKLLRVLQEREIERIGGKQPIKVNVRIIAATNRNLEKEVAEGRFRLDLYYRLNVFPISLPALRERREDIEVLANYFARQFSRKFKKEFPGISAGMLQELEVYNWPGNIRELENIIEQSMILNDGKTPIQLKRSLPGTKNLSAPIADNPTINSLEDIKAVQLLSEKEYIISTLKKTHGKIRGADGAAALLNQKPTTLESRISRLGIRKEDYA